VRYREREKDRERLTEKHRSKERLMMSEIRKKMGAAIYPYIYIYI
jgi:hypothetical protein